MPHLQPGALPKPAPAPERRTKPKLVERRRAKATRDLAHRLQPSRTLSWIPTTSLRRDAGTAAQPFELEYDSGEPLPHLVVQLAGDAAPLCLLRSSVRRLPSVRSRSRRSSIELNALLTLAISRSHRPSRIRRPGSYGSIRLITAPALEPPEHPA